MFYLILSTVCPKNCNCTATVPFCDRATTTSTAATTTTTTTTATKTSNVTSAMTSSSTTIGGASTALPVVEDGISAGVIGAIVAAIVFVVCVCVIAIYFAARFFDLKDEVDLKSARSERGEKIIFWRFYFLKRRLLRLVRHKFSNLALQFVLGQ